MVIVVRKSMLIIVTTCILVVSFVFAYLMQGSIDLPVASQSTIKWVDFNIPSTALEKALKLDVDSYNQPVSLHWIELLSCLGSKYGGNFKSYKPKDLDDLATRLKNGETMDTLSGKMKSYPYYLTIYSAVLDGFVGEFEVQSKKSSPEEETVWESKYGLKAFSPIAKGYSYYHYEDFGNARSYGFKRKHLGNDLMGNVGTPIIAVESGTIEALGWNMYGGWRIGIRSFDKKRYYYYAHLRKDHPYHAQLFIGSQVKAGDVIGYLGMTGYSKKENVNNIKPPHLHFGLQLIFDESQKEGNNEIWIDVYPLVEFLKKSKSSVQRDPTTKDYYRQQDIKLPEWCE